MTRLIFILSALLLLLVACDSSTSGADTRVASYVVTSPCAAHTDSASCAADTAQDCAWLGLGVSCPDGTTCPG
ncbi:MAG: hypothetical protein WBM46_06000, partial [Polyangiales bacterium]